MTVSQGAGGVGWDLEMPEPSRPRGPREGIWAFFLGVMRSHGKVLRQK